MSSSWAPVLSPALLAEQQGQGGKAHPSREGLVEEASSCQQVSCHNQASRHRGEIRFCFLYPSESSSFASKPISTEYLA